MPDADAGPRPHREVAPPTDAPVDPVRTPGRAAGARDRWAWLAALVAFGLGALAALMMVAGHQPWDGPVVASFTQTHGLHLGDVLSIVPLVVGIGLARWCWTRRH